MREATTKQNPSQSYYNAHEGSFNIQLLSKNLCIKFRHYRDNLISCSICIDTNKI